MGYSIKQAAEKVNLTVYTLRYYEKEGLLPFVSRNKAGNRVFSDSDLDWLCLICCLKNTGMPIKQIGTFIQWCMEGDSSLERRRQMLIEHRQVVVQQIKDLNHNLEAINCKIDHYDMLCNPQDEAAPAPALADAVE